MNVFYGGRQTRAAQGSAAAKDAVGGMRDAGELTGFAVDMARRIADPLWSALDSYFARLAAGEPEDLMSLRSAAFGLSATPDAAPVGDGEL